jgi:hypothetical protein
MAVLDRAMRSDEPAMASEDQEFVLTHVDGIEFMGFCNHYKLPHYVTFQSDLDRLRQARISRAERKDHAPQVSQGYSLLFKSDNTYARDFNQDDIPVVLGSVKVSGNVIIVNDDSGGRYSCVDSTTGQVVSGSYTYVISGNTPTFNLFHDPCSDRAAFLCLTYLRQ